MDIKTTFTGIVSAKVLGDDYMISLLKRDIILSRKPIIFIGLLVIIWSIIASFTQDKLLGQLIFGYLLFFQSYYLVIVLSQQDERVKSDLIINSLPIDRKLVVLEKYVFLVLQPISIAIFMILTTRGIHALQVSGFQEGQNFTLFGAIVAIALTWFVLSIYIPINYLSIGKSKAFNQLSLMILIVLPSFFTRLIKINGVPELPPTLMNISPGIVISGLLGFALIIYFISYLISKKIYSRKDFY